MILFFFSDEESCKYNFYVGRKGTDHNEFIKEGEELESAQKEGETKFLITLEKNDVNEIKANEIDWLVIGCNYEGTPYRIAYLEFPENVVIPTTTTSTTTTTTAKPTTTKTTTEPQVQQSNEDQDEDEDEDEDEDQDGKGSSSCLQIGLWTPLMLSAINYYLAQTRTGLF